MEELVSFVLTRQTIDICNERVNDHNIYECDALVISLMYTAIILGRLDDFKYLWEKWAPALMLEEMIEFIKTDCGGSAEEFLSYLQDSGRCEEYGII